MMMYDDGWGWKLLDDDDDDDDEANENRGIEEEAMAPMIKSCVNRPTEEELEEIWG